MDTKKQAAFEVANRFVNTEKVTNANDTDPLVGVTEFNKNCPNYDENMLIKKLNSFFEANFNSVKKLVSPELRKILLKMKTNGFFDLLDSCYILRTLLTGIFYTDCKNFIANFVDLTNFSLHSTDPLNNLTNLNDKSLLEDHLRILIRKTRSIYLDKHSIKPSNLNNIPVKVLIYIGKFLVQPYEPVQIQPRCVICISKLSSMKKSGIILSCKHTICFECHMENSIFCCPIDNLGSQQNFPYLSLNNFFPHCQGLHCLINCTMIYKLACGHLTCITCLSNSNCLSCYSKINPFLLKSAIKVQKWVDEQNLYCDAHNEKAVAFSIEEFRMYCGNCRKAESIDLKFFPGFEFFDNVFDIEFLELINNEKCKFVEYSCEFLKKCSFFKVLSLRQKYETVRILMDIAFDCSSLLRIQERVEFFSKLYPVHPKSKKVLKILNEFSVHIKFSTHFMVVGIILGGKFTVIKLSEKVLPVFFIVKKFQLLSSGQVIYSQESFKPISGHSVEINLDNPVKVEPFKEYSLVLELPSGSYMHGAPFSRKKSPQISSFGTLNSRFNLLGLKLIPI